MLFMSQSYEHSAQHCEDISLYECHKHLKAVHEKQHYDAESIQPETEANAHRPS